MSSKVLDQMLADIRDLMKAKDAARLTALRTLHAQIKDATINAGKEVTDAEVATVVARAIKQRQEAAEQYRQGGRPELAEKELMEAELFRKYQPPQLTDADLEALARDVIAVMGATGPGDAGKVMGTLMPRVKGQADGKRVQQVVRRLLGG